MPQPHFVMISTGSLGDLYPFLSLAQALQQLGRKVTLFGMTYHADIVTAAGVPFVGIGTNDDYWNSIKDPDLWHPIKGFKVFLRHYREYLIHGYETFKTFPTEDDYILLCHPMAMPGADLFRHLHPNAKVVAVHLAPASLRTCYDPLSIGWVNVPRWIPLRLRQIAWQLIDTLAIDPIALPHLNAVYTQLGLPNIRHFFPYLANIPDLTVTLFPQWFTNPPPDWPQPLLQGDFPLFDPKPEQVLNPALTAFLQAGRKPLLFTPGTAHCNAAAYFRTALEAINSMGERAIFLTQYREQLPEQLPDNVLWQAYVPLQMLLPHVAAIIFHGGIGTMAEAFRAGVPQLVVPFAWDQFDNAARMKLLGVGLSIPAIRLSKRRLVKKLQALLHSTTIATQCQIVAQQFHGKATLNQFVQQIEQHFTLA